MKEIENSSDVDTDLNDEDPLSSSKNKPAAKSISAKAPAHPGVAIEVLKEVAIPADSLQRVQQGPNGSSRTSSLSINSALSSIKDQSSECETPGTSVAVTPAESIFKAPSRTSGQKSKPKKTDLLSKEESNSTGKRKRNSSGADALLDDDALLAKALQEEEYAKDDVQPVKGRKCRQALLDDSDEDMENTYEKPKSLFNVSDNESGSLSDLKAGPSPRKRRKLAGGRFSLPSRPSRDQARRSIKEKADAGIQDSDDSAMSESTFTISDNDLEISEDDMVDSDDVSRAASAQPPTAQPPTAPKRVTKSKVTGGAASRAFYAYRARLAERLGSMRAARERISLEKAHPEIQSMWETLESVATIVPEQAEQPKAITRKLKSFQLEGLSWMMKQESSQWKGGLLGDEMGMGKTIQAVSLIMSNYPAKSPSLVVVPPVALMQWQNEINEYTDGKLKVLVYHNSNQHVKNMTMEELISYDVIMISYSGVESIHRKEVKGWNREDGIIKENSMIHAIHYHRLILDEAHSIKSRTTGVAKACFALKADYKWCLSGTPVQNRIGEFFSLLRFLEVRPFACYFCKVCPCAELHWSQDEKKKCIKCGHTGFQHVSIFNQELLNPITQGQNNALRKEGLGKLRLITDRIMLRRMKRDYTASLELPPKDVIIHNEFFGEIEHDFSKSIMSNSTRQFDTYVSRGVMLNNYANIFGLIMQMRQVANHPDLILKKHAQGGQNVLVCCVCDETAEEPIRSRCHHEFCRSCAKNYVKSFDAGVSPDCPRCHILLNIDFEQPDIEQDEDHVKKSSIINRIKMEDWTSSTKIEMLVYDLYKLRSPKQTHKSIVFSQFTSMLQLVEWRLRRAGFSTVMLDGSMSPSQRQKSIEYFMNNTHVEVFLVSLKAGGVALNLTEASRVFIIDP